MRPDRLVVVTGTGTDVGKTWVGARLLGELVARGVRVAARKPAQSFAADAEARGEETDAHALARASGEHVHAVCPRHRWYEMAMAPPMAAEALGRPSFTVADLVAEIRWPEDIQVGIVEGVGGPRSPLAANGDTVDLAHALTPDAVLVVAPADLGAINAVRLAAAPFEDAVVVLLNRYAEADPVHRANARWLEERAEEERIVLARSVDELVSWVAETLLPRPRPTRGPRRQRPPADVDRL